MARRVIFLDIDGVLAPIHHWDRYGDLDPACIRVLNEIAAQGSADVVVSSTWRYGRTVAQLQAMLDAQGFTGRVIGMTPTGPLEAHAVDGFVIIDDHLDMGALGAHLVQTHSAHGLRPADAPSAIATLRRALDPRAT